MQLFGRKISGISYQRRPFSASAPLFGFEMSTTQKCRQESVMVSKYWCCHFFLSSSNDSIAILCTNHKGLSIHAKSSLTPLPSTAYEVKELLRRHDSRLKRGDVPNPKSAILPFRSITGTIKDLRPISECYYSPHATFTIQFEVAQILPAFIPTSSNPLHNFCMKQKDGSSKLQFSLHVRDASSETDILCLGKVAEDILGITPRDILERSDRCESAICQLQHIVSPGSRCRGTIRSCVKNGNTYFFMKSMSCITIAVDT